MYNYKPRDYEKGLEIRKRLFHSTGILESDEEVDKASALSEMLLSSSDLLQNDIAGFISYVSTRVKMSNTLSMTLTELSKLLTDEEHVLNLSAVDLTLNDDIFKLLYTNEKIRPIQKKDFYGNYSNQFNILTSKLGISRTCKLMNIFSELVYLFKIKIYTY